MRKKTIAKRAPREKIYKLPTKPATRSQDRTFTPSPSPPTSPPRSSPMARTKTTPRIPVSAKPTPPPKATSSKPGSSKPGFAKPSSSKGKRPATEEPVPEPPQPRARSVPVRSQRGKTRVPLKSVSEPDIGPFDHKAHFLTSHSNYNPYRFKSTMNNDFYEGVIQYHTLCPSFLADLPSLKRKGTAHSYVKGRDIVLNNETISDALKYTDVGPCAYTSVK
nr:pistil-specific extensin-like protein [Arachis hypogaea]